jgi:hypothetical protein
VLLLHAVDGALPNVLTQPSSRITAMAARNALLRTPAVHRPVRGWTPPTQ